MKKLFDAADRYLKIADWKDMALLKFCLFSMGVLAFPGKTGTPPGELRWVFSCPPTSP